MSDHDANPLIFAETTRLGEVGQRVHIGCREPQFCLSGEIHGPSAVIHAAMAALEKIHQAAHRISVEGDA